MNDGISLELKTDLVRDPKLGEHALTEQELNELRPRVETALQEIADERAGGELHRFRNLPHDRSHLESVRKVIDDYKDSTDNLIVLGIGGSALGNIALQSALNSPTYNLLPTERRGGPRLFVLDNVDPVFFESVMEVVSGDWSRTLVNVISKSGETAETSAQFLIVRDRLIKALGEAEGEERLVVTTDSSAGTMRKIVDDQEYRSLLVPDGVGGRFTVLSAVGLLSAGMCGIDIEGLLDGAAAMDQVVSRPNIDENLAAQLAMIYYLYDQRGKPMHVMMPYSNQLRDMADWYRQLYAESLGKIRPSDGKMVGPTPIKALGATDQHSQVQLYREGPNDKVITFLETEAFECDSVIPMQFEGIEAMEYLGRSKRGSLAGLLSAEKHATELALLESQRPSLTIKFPEITPRSVGEFIYLYESMISIMGKLYEIDPYDQPAVELGKLLTFHLMGRRGHEKSPI